MNAVRRIDELAALVTSLDYVPPEVLCGFAKAAVIALTNVLDVRPACRVMRACMHAWIQCPRRGSNSQRQAQASARRLLRELCEAL
jgi:hypothetical protein